MADKIKLHDIAVQTRNGGIWWMHKRSDRGFEGKCVCVPLHDDGWWHVGKTSLFPGDDACVKMVGHSTTEPDPDVALAMAVLMLGDLVKRD